MRRERPAMFVSTFMYSAAKVTGPRWDEVLQHELTHLDESPWPGFRTIGQARRVAPCNVFVDGSTYITRARCVAAGHFLRKSGKDCDVWLTVDDDLYADQSVIAQLVDGCRATGGLVALPYANRDGNSMTFRFVRGSTQWIAGVDERVPLRIVDRIGMGLVAMHRSFVEALDRTAVHFEDHYPAIFLEGVQDTDPLTGRGVWTGEDYWLCGLAEAAGLPMHVLLDAVGEHQGIRAKLDLDGTICIQGQAAADKMQAGLEAAGSR